MDGGDAELFQERQGIRSLDLHQTVGEIIPAHMIADGEMLFADAGVSAQ